MLKSIIVLTVPLFRIKKLDLENVFRSSLNVLLNVGSALIINNILILPPVSLRYEIQAFILSEYVWEER